MTDFDDYNPFRPPRESSAMVVELKRTRQKQETARQEVKNSIREKCRQIGPIQLPLPHIRRRSA